MKSPVTAAIWVSGLMVGVAIAAAAALVLAGGTAATLDATDTTASAPAQLNVDAIPPHSRHLASWVVRAGSICPEINPPLIAAQIEQESGWNPDAVAHNPPERGGDAMGIAQFQQATWDTWGEDANGNGVNNPYDPEDAVWAQGQLMCDLVAWAQRQIAARKLGGDPIDLALAAYFCGRACILAAGGVPAGGLTADYPTHVRARVSTYTQVGLFTAGEWVMPLPEGSYRITSGFGMRWGRFHAGVDLAAPTGTPIYAVASGVVLDAGCTSQRCDIPGSLDMPGCGLRVTINHGDGLVTRYCHAVALNAVAGEQVAVGHVIAWVGSTGHSTGPHLHFEVDHRDTAVDPTSFLDIAR